MNLFRLNQVCEINPPKDIKNLSGMEISFVPMEAVSTEGRVDTSRSISGDKVKSYSVFKNRDVLFAKITPCMENGKGGIVNNLKNGYGAGSTEFIVIRPDETKVTSEWIKMFLSQTSFRYDCRNNMTGSAGQKRVPPKFLASKTIPVPPLEDQHRIVTRIEELFSQLDSGVETLKKTKEQLKVYRQAVLKEAFEGNWKIFKAKDLCFFITKGTTPKKTELRTTGDIPFIKVYNLTFDTSLDFSIEPTFVSKEIHSGFLARSIVYPDDVLMNIVGPPMGKVSIVPNTYNEWNINQAIARFRCNDNLYNKYLAYYLGFAPTVEKMKAKSKATAGQFNLTLEICRNIEIPLPTLENQKEIVKEIESRLSVCDSIEKTIDTALQEAEALRQSILKQAFEGGL